MAILHVFNPEHDIALASNLANFTAPHAGRQLRSDLAFLPALWAKEGDAVLVDNLESARKAWGRVHARVQSLLGRKASFMDSAVSLHGKRCFLTWKTMFSNMENDEVNPWGWDRALKGELTRKGFDVSLLPSDVRLEQIRQLSHRRTAARLLPQLQSENTVGEAFECTQAEEVEVLLSKYGQVVMKAPWSSSGRGLRFLSQERTPFQIQAAWFRHLVERQGSVMVEPFYSKVKDFGMEFYADGKGHIRYEGLSLFHTANGAYVGNILATECKKREMISRYIPVSWLDDVQEKILSCSDLGDYEGPLGVDMMIVKANDRCLLHPCVEINLRRTMGHVALAISPTDDDIQGVMRVIYDGNHYKLKINKLR